MNRPAKTDASDLDRLFGALADPTRRSILEHLQAKGEMTAGDLSDCYPAISRPAVSKHLKILREAELVIEERSGRFVIYRLPEATFTQPADAWLEPFRAVWRGKLQDLKRFVESGPLPD